MDNDFLGKALTLSNGEKWYICDSTVQDGDVYYLALQLDANDDPEGISKIFKEIKKDDVVLLDDQIEAEKSDYLSAIFLSKYDNNFDEIIKAIMEEEAA